MTRVSTSAVVLLALAAEASGQVVFEKVRVNMPQGPEPKFLGETAIRQSRNNPNEFIAAVMCGILPSCEIHYAIATQTNPDGTPAIALRAVLDKAGLLHWRFKP